MKIGFYCLLFMTGIISTQAQTTIYDINAEVRQLPKFSSIEVSGTISLYLSQGNETGVAISAEDEKNNSKIKTEVIEGVLKISVEGGIWNTFSLANKQLKAYVSVVDISRLTISGASYVSINGVLKSNLLQVNISGASEVKGNVNLQNFDLDMSGASVVRLAGSVSEGTIDASGASKINSYDLSFRKLKVNASGASQIRITAKEELAADASGGSTIYYKGDAIADIKNTHGGSRIRKRNENED